MDTPAQIQARCSFSSDSFLYGSLVSLKRIPIIFPGSPMVKVFSPERMGTFILFPHRRQNVQVTPVSSSTGSISPYHQSWPKSLHQSFLSLFNFALQWPLSAAGCIQTTRDPMRLRRVLYAGR